ncbi:MAG TPA: SDR family oxidoreductase [Candidatus Limnocylindrales bacterium]|nr:SDR family oxidoreductase [Candidatus Limnocylindrales bacterium]
MIAIFGGTGNLGRELVPLLAAQGSPIRVISRHGRAPDARSWPANVQDVAGDLRDRAVLDAALDGVDTVVSAISGFGGRDPLGSRAVDRDGNIALIEAAQRRGVTTFVMLSIHDAGPRHPIALFRDKWAAEEALRSSGLSWTIIRPTAYLEAWLELVGGPLVETGRTRIFGTGRNPVNFVSVVDVARFVQLAIADPSVRPSAIEVPGPENLTLDQLAALVETASGRAGRKDHVPRAMLRAVRLATGTFKPTMSALVGAALVMDTSDMAVDGPAHRNAFPSIPSTTAADVARRMFAATSNGTGRA